MWENTVWEEIKEVTIKDYEIEKVTTVAGVRGAEAEDEALNKLYYRKSMRSLSLLDLQKVYGKLVAKKEKMEKDKVNTDVIDNYILVINKKIKTYIKIILISNLSFLHYIYRCNDTFKKNSRKHF